MTPQETNRVHRNQADYFETVSPVLSQVIVRTADEYEQLYLAAWKKVYQKYPHYLYKDDRFCDELGLARKEDVSALSFERTADDLRQARTDTAHTLNDHDKRRFAASTDNTHRPMLADLLKKAAQQLAHHLPVFEALNDVRFELVLPPMYSSTPDRAVDEPGTVGGALGLLDYCIDLHEKFLRAEEELNATQPDGLGLDTPAAPATSELLDIPASFWKALRRIPMLVEWENNSPRYTVPVHLLGYDDFNEDLRPLREAFEAALPKLKTKHLRLLRGELGELLSIDRQSFRRREALYNEQKYALQFLPDDYPILRFEVAEPGRGLARPWQWVNPSIWTGFAVLLQYKQEVARAIYDKISAALDRPPYPLPEPTPQPDNPPLDMAPPAPLTVADLCRDGFTPADVLAPAVPTLADLCRAPFTPTHLNELLVRLKVISPAGACLTNELRGKAQGPRAAFTAAYRVLHWAELLKPVPDRVWAATFLEAYGAILKKGAISHKLTARGTATPTAPLPFTEAVNIAREWVAEWQDRQ